MNAVTENSALKIAETQPTDLPVIATSSAALILDSASMDSMMRLAEVMAKGRATVPQHLQGNQADCGAIIMQAIQWRMNPYAVAQKTHIVNGALGYESQLVNAVIQSSGVTVDRFNYEWFGPWEKIIGKTKVVDVPAKGDKKAYQFRVPDYGMEDENGMGVRVWATLKGETEPRVLELLLVQASVRNSPLWATDPKQQLAYLAVKRWTRLYAPDVILGVYTPDELEEVNREIRDITPVGTAPAVPELSPALLAEARNCASQGISAYQKFWADTGTVNRKALAAHHEELKADAVKADQRRTVEMPASNASNAAPSGMEELLADLEAAAVGGVEDFDAAWNSLSATTQEKLATQYQSLRAHAEKTGGAK